MLPHVLGCVAFLAFCAGCSVALLDDDASLLAHEPRALGPADSGPGTIKLATWNLQWLHREEDTGPVPRDAADYIRLARYAERLAADIVALQEVDGPEAAARVFDPEVYDFHFAAQSSTQRVGFAFRRGLEVTLAPDYAALDLGGLRRGVVLGVNLRGTEFQLLALHLKSGCFDAPLSTPSPDCLQLNEQLQLLEAWIEGRAAEGTPMVVLGDFNRRLFAVPSDEFWLALNDDEPPSVELLAPTSQAKARCWGGEFPDFIDHLVFGGAASAWVSSASLREISYEPEDAAFRTVLSDHCPLVVDVTVPERP